MTDKPHMTLPSGDKLYEGDYGCTRDGQMVGPLRHDKYCDISQSWDARSSFHRDIERQLWSPSGAADENDCLDIIAKWTEAPAQTEAIKLWRDMTPEEKGALLLAAHEGKVIEVWVGGKNWLSTHGDPEWENCLAYRIRPEPKRETVTLYSADGLAWSSLHGTNAKWRQTYDLIDGRLDLASIRMEEINA